MNLKKTALTLTELLVASILMGIIALGVISFSVNVAQMQDAASKSAILQMQTMGVIAQMRADANQIVKGDTDPGVLWDQAKKDWLAFRKDANPPTLTNYADDTWVSYTIYTVSGNTKLAYCSFLAGQAPAKCVDGQSTVLLQNLVAGSQLEWIEDKAAHKFFANITLTTRSDSTIPANPLKNPEYTLTTAITPKQSVSSF